MTRSRWLVAVAVLSIGCEGRVGLPSDGSKGSTSGVGGGGGGMDATPSCTGLCLGATQLPRITAVEYANSVLDVFGVPFTSNAIPSDGQIGSGFSSNDPEALGVQSNGADLYQQGAEDYATTVVTQSGVLTGLLAPLACAKQDATCADAFVAKYVAQLYRRPLSADETADYHALYAWTVKTATDAAFATGGSGTFTDGIQYIVEKALQSPGFLYRPELGSPTDDPQVVQLTSRELAVRLAAFLTRSVPDADLLAAADQGALETPAQIASQVERLMKGATGPRLWQSFSREWLSTSQLAGMGADQVQHETGASANWTDATPGALSADVTETFTYLMQNDGTVYGLLTSAGGVSQGDDLKWIVGTTAAKESWQTVMPNRLGLLTWPGMIVANGLAAGHDAFSHAHFRGLWIRSHLLCQTVASFSDPSKVQMALDDETAMPTAQTDRDRMQAVTEYLSGTQTQIQPCYSCHHLTNPLGYSLDGYDNLGRHRTTQTGVDGKTYPVDETGVLTDDNIASMTTDVDGPVTSGADLIQRLSSSATVAHCLERQLARFAFMRETVSDDQPSLDAAYQTFDSNDRNLRTLVAVLASSDAFRYRRIPQPAGP